MSNFVVCYCPCVLLDGDSSGQISGYAAIANNMMVVVKYFEMVIEEQTFIDWGGE